MADVNEAPDESLTHETDRRLATITSRYPDRFSPHQVEEIRDRIERSIRHSRTLRAVALANGDGPDLIVTALPPRTESA